MLIAIDEKNDHYTVLLVLHTVHTWANLPRLNWDKY